MKTPGMTGTLAFAGLNGASFTNAPNAGTMFVDLLPKEERGPADEIHKDLSARLSSITAGDAFVIPPPPVRGIGTSGGYKMIIEDRSAQGYQALEKVASRWPPRRTRRPG